MIRGRAELRADPDHRSRQGMSRREPLDHRDRPQCRDPLVVRWISEYRPTIRNAPGSSRTSPSRPRPMEATAGDPPGPNLDCLAGQGTCIPSPPWSPIGVPHAGRRRRSQHRRSAYKLRKNASASKRTGSSTRNAAKSGPGRHAAAATALALGACLSARAARSNAVERPVCVNDDQCGPGFAAPRGLIQPASRRAPGDRAGPATTPAPPRPGSDRAPSRRRHLLIADSKKTSPPPSHGIVTERASHMVATVRRRSRYTDLTFEADSGATDPLLVQVPAGALAR